MSITVVGLGAGGHSRVVIEIVRAYQKYEIVGILDPKIELHGKEIGGIPIVGADSQIEQMVAAGVRHFFVGVGSVGDSSRRHFLFELGLRHGLIPIEAIQQSAVVSESATLGKGVTVMAGAIISSGAKIGDNVIVNSGAIVEHDCRIEDHVHIATGACLGGAVHVDRAAHVGIGATVREGIRIGSRAIVGAGAVVIRNVPDKHVVVGVPARFLYEVGSSIES